MSTTLTIPADVIPDIREGLYGLLGVAADRIAGYLVYPDRDAMVDGFIEARSQLERVFPLLDLVGWSTRELPHSIDVDVADHGQTLKDAVHEYLPHLETWEAEADDTDRQRTQDGQPPRKPDIQKSLAACRNLLRLLERRLGELA
jgi:hypothetical protein